MSGKNRRWLYAAAGVIVLLLAGLVYAWSVLSAPVAAYFPEWSKAQLSLTFTICMGFFCIGGFLGGLANRRIPVRIHVWASAVLFFIGFLIASRAQSVGVLYAGYGVLCGFASGLVYNAVMSTVSGWFPDKPGLISGLLLMGFGISSFLVGKIYQAVTPSGVGVEAWRNSFFAFGALILVVMGVCGFFFVKPTAKDLEGLAGPAGGGRAAGKAPAAGKASAEGKASAKGKASVTGKAPVLGKAAGSVGSQAQDWAPMEMLRTSSFWLYFAWAILLSAAGLALISQATGVASEVGQGVDAGTIATVVGLISVCNGIGRVIFGGMYDRMGRGKTMAVITGAFLISVCVLVFALIQKSFGVITVGFICTGFSYGGINPTNSAFISDYYGRTHYPVNFSIINMNLLVSSFGSTIAGMLYDRSGSFLSTFLAMIGAAVLAFVCSVLIKKPVR